MTTVYVVTSGERKDYSVDGVFSTRKLAESYVELHSRLDVEQGLAETHWEIDEWLLDNGLNDVLVNCYKCTIIVETGDIDEHSWHERMDESDAQALIPSVSEYGDMCVSNSYVSAEHARELAAEARERVIAQRTVSI